MLCEGFMSPDLDIENDPILSHKMSRVDGNGAARATPVA